VYAIADGDAVTLIDGGWALGGGPAPSSSRRCHDRRTLRDIRRFLVTHAHATTTRRPVAIRREHRTPVLIGVRASATPSNGWSDPGTPRSRAVRHARPPEGRAGDRRAARRGLRGEVKAGY